MLRTVTILPDMHPPTQESASLSADHARCGIAQILYILYFIPKIAAASLLHIHITMIKGYDTKNTDVIVWRLIRE